MSNTKLDELVPQAAEGRPKAKEYQTSNPEISALETEARTLEIAAKKLEILEREANLQDVTERLAERQLKREQIKMRAVTNGATIKQLNREAKAVQERCNHHKGGDGAHGIVGGQGQDQQYAVIKHKMANGDLWVICLRCGKKWKPPVRSSFETDVAYLEAVADYKVATQFPTRNQTSTSYQYKWSDDGALYREAVANS